MQQTEFWSRFLKYIYLRLIINIIPLLTILILIFIPHFLLIITIIHFTIDFALVLHESNNPGNFSLIALI